MEIIKISILIILIAIYNGLIINWRCNYKNKSAFWNNMWHFIGALLRVCFIFFLTDWKTAIAIILMHWIVYDAIINLIRGKPIFYEGSQSSGTGSLIDKILNNYLSIILKTLSFLTGLIYFLLC